jgi:hypothetical protein
MKKIKMFRDKNQDSSYQDSDYAHGEGWVGAFGFRRWAWLVARKIRYAYG